ncbi:MAG: hypothetical protein GY909_06255 [Oligoflexia bacterium]|nr:hypothetical protein [Oligoflexia bacterium]
MPQRLQKKHERSSSRITLSTNHPLLDSYILGKKRGLDRKTVRAHEVLGIKHWMTPSGLHFGVIFFFLLFLFKKQSLPLKILLFLTSMALGQTNLTSLERVSWLTFFLQFDYFESKNKKKLISFSLMVIICLLNGNFLKSPVGFFLSLSFISLFYFSNQFHSSNILRLYILQLFTQSYFSGHFYPIGSIANFFLTPILFIIFPVLSFFNFINQSIVDYFQEALIWFSKLAIIKIKFDWYYLIVLLICYFVFKLDQRFKITFITAGILCFQLFPKPLYNFNHSNIRKGFYSPPPKEYLYLREHKKRVISYHPHGIVCSNLFVGNGWSTHCRQTSIEEAY